MKTLQKTLIALAVGSLVSVGAQAAISYGNGYTGQPYVGVKVGKFDVDLDGADDPTAYGVYAGYNFDPRFGVEAEYVGSSDADFGNGELDAKTYGLYGTYRHSFTNTGLYGKAKLGVAKTELEATNGNFSASASDTGVAGGLGLGYNVSPNLGVEAEYDFIDSDTNLMTVGAHLKF